MLVVKEMKTKAVGAFMVPSKEVSEHSAMTVVDFMSGYECGRSILKSDGELFTMQGRATRFSRIGRREVANRTKQLRMQ